jgi:hypothetical protein
MFRAHNTGYKSCDIYEEKAKLRPCHKRNEERTQIYWLRTSHPMKLLYVKVTSPNLILTASQAQREITDNRHYIGLHNDMSTVDKTQKVYTSPLVFHNFLN